MDNIKVSNITKTFDISRSQAKLENVKKRKRVAVKELSFNVKKGEIYSLLGPNGAGKTTALRCIAGLISLDEGSIHINNVDIRKNKRFAKSKVAFLTSELKLDEKLTPNYLFDFFYKLTSKKTKGMRSRKEELFKRFGITPFKEVRVADLSSGMKQKVSITMVLANDPDYIIFDEPTNGLDVLTTKEIIEYLKEMRDKGKGIIISTHIMSLAQKVSDRVGVIIDGKQVLEESIESLEKRSEEKGEVFDLEDMFFNLINELDKGGTA